MLPPSALAAAPTLIPVPHVRQAFTWDCGLACAFMVLRAARAAGPETSLASLRRAVATRSVWTIDVAHVLAAAGVPVTLTTTMPGANPAYEGEAFYSPTLADDAARVSALFAAAPAAGVAVQRRRVASGELGARLLGGEWLVVALVDRRALAAAWPPSAAWGCGSVDENESKPEWPAPASRHPPPPHASSSTGYMGHYIVLCGYDPVTHTFALRDPAATAARGPLRLPGAALDAARTAFGTDEDLLHVRVRGWRQAGRAVEVGA